MCDLQLVRWVLPSPKTATAPPPGPILTQCGRAACVGISVEAGKLPAHEHVYDVDDGKRCQHVDHDDADYDVHEPYQRHGGHEEGCVSACQ